MDNQYARRLYFLSFILFSLIGLSKVYSQSATAIIKGKIIDQNGEGIPFVNVVLKNTSMTTLSDEDGHYIFNRVPADNYTIKASAEGYKSYEEPIELEEGDVLNITFNNTAGTAKAYLNGSEQIDLEQEKAASGIWYKNDQYELRGKGNDISLKKDGETVFKHEDDKVNVEAKNDKGDVLTMTFNNTAGSVKAYLNGGEQIDLEQKKAASGIWYENDEYELLGKGDNYMLIKDGETVFEN